MFVNYHFLVDIKHILGSKMSPCICGLPGETLAHFVLVTESLQEEL